MENNNKKGTEIVVGILSHFIQPSAWGAAVIASLLIQGRTMQEQVTLSTLAMRALLACAVEERRRAGNNLTTTQKSAIQAFIAALPEEGDLLADNDNNVQLTEAVQRAFFAVHQSKDAYSGLVQFAPERKQPGFRHLADVSPDLILHIAAQEAQAKASAAALTVQGTLSNLNFRHRYDYPPLLTGILTLNLGSPVPVVLTLRAIVALVAAEVTQRGEDNLTDEQKWFVDATRIVYRQVRLLALNGDDHLYIVTAGAGIGALMELTVPGSTFSGLFDLQLADSKLQRQPYAAPAVINFTPELETVEEG